MKHETNTSNRLYTNACLTAIAFLLGAVVSNQWGGNAMPFDAVAHAEPETGGGGLISAADQRKQIVNELKVVGKRIDRLEARLHAGIKVKVIDMPAIKVEKD